jgi:hypothetical protein
MKNQNKKDLELGLILISNEINYVMLELIKYENYDNMLVQKGIKALMNSIVIAKVETFLNYDIIDNNEELINELSEFSLFKKSKETTPSNNNLKFALHRYVSCIKDLQFSLIYNELENINTQHYIIRLLKYLVKEDLTIYLTTNKVFLN